MIFYEKRVELVPDNRCADNHVEVNKVHSNW